MSLGVLSITRTALQRIGLILIVLVLCAKAYSLPQSVRAELNGTQLLGSGRYSFLFSDVYDISLYGNTQVFNPAQPFALKIDYLMPLKGEAIVDRTISLIKRQAFNDEVKLTQWRAALAEIFSDVDKGISLTGFKDKNGHTHFYRNEQWVGVVADAQFSDYFFAIWLAEHTSEPKLRRQLLGAS